METMTITDGLTLFFEAGEQEAADLIREASEQSARLLRQHWGLPTPEDCRVYVLTAWRPFFFHAAPWPWRILVGLSLPVWSWRASRLWPYAGGWAVRYGRRRAVGVKPPRLMALADRSLGERLFIREDQVSDKVRHVTCHELTHAFTAHLKLPLWLNEGLAMVAVDKLFGRPTVEPETLAALTRSSRPTGPRSYRRVSVKDPDALVYQYIRGYWLTRYLDEAQPGLLKRLLARRSSHRALEGEVAAALGMERAAFWRAIDGVVVAHFQPGGAAG